MNQKNNTKSNKNNKEHFSVLGTISSFSFIYMLITLFAVFLSIRCNKKKFDFPHFLSALFCAPLYIAIMGGIKLEECISGK